jgi:hypothetical protein
MFKNINSTLVVRTHRMTENIDGMHMCKNIKQKGKKEEIYHYDII